MQVLASSHAAARRTGPAQYLGEQPFRIRAVSQVVPVPPMIAHDHIAVEQRRQSDRHVLLTEAGMCGSADLAVGEQIQQSLLETAYEQKRRQIYIRQSRERIEDDVLSDGHVHISMPLVRSSSRSLPTDRVVRSSRAASLMP